MDKEKLTKLCERIPPFDKRKYDEVMAQWDAIAKPIDGLGDMERLIARIGGIQGRHTPEVSNRTLIVFFADNGITEEGVTQTDSNVTHAVAEAMAKNSSTVCVMAKQAGVKVLPVDIGMKGDPVPGITDRRIREGTGDFLATNAMSQQETYAAIDIGCEMADEAIDAGCDMLLLGEMGIGNTSTATAVSCALLGMDPQDYVGRGAGLSDDMLAHKTQVIREALKRHTYDRNDVIQVLSIFGGFDIAGMTGAVLEAARRRVPVIADGLITLSAILVAQRLCPVIKDLCIPSHRPREAMGRCIMSELCYTALIDAGLALGEGTGAVLLMPLIDVCYRLFTEGARFGGIGIDAYERFDEVER
ncbi:MAG: nicotinate-nucleotide--dimethylbenzimidazole phosphoribosyltransferase [Lachnospiraceae bacterium]|nr:nicotinate-nucleotide--dimethylbenzimidazole phosphoribosyltransferase [Lachnospiraceae bacterium]